MSLNLDKWRPTRIETIASNLPGRVGKVDITTFPDPSDIPDAIKINKNLNGDIQISFKYPWSNQKAEIVHDKAIGKFTIDNQNRVTNIEFACIKHLQDWTSRVRYTNQHSNRALVMQACIDLMTTPEFSRLNITQKNIFNVK